MSCFVSGKRGQWGTLAASVTSRRARSREGSQRGRAQSQQREEQGAVGVMLQPPWAGCGQEELPGPRPGERCFLKLPPRNKLPGCGLHQARQPRQGSVKRPPGRAEHQGREWCREWNPVQALQQELSSRTGSEGLGGGSSRHHAGVTNGSQRGLVRVMGQLVPR